MNLLRLAWKNMVFRPLNSGLSVLLLALGVGLIALLLLLQKQLNENFDNNLAGVDLIIGAKGSPLQMILSSMYHIDAPTGNVTLQQVRPFLNPEHPLIEEAVPLSLGDNFLGYRIVGATPNILEWYGAELGAGRLYNQNLEAIVGAEVAQVGALELGDQFSSSHGLLADDELAEEHDHDFKLVGVLKPSGTVLDQLILVTNQSYWIMHDDHADHEEGHDHGDHEEHEHADHEEGHDHGDHEGHEHADHEEGHDHGDHEEHEHADHEEGHDHGDHEEHEHADHEEGHDHGDHEGHDHADHEEGHDHGDHEGHDHADHEEGHDHGDHEGHEHADHTGHNHSDAGGPISPADLLEEDPTNELTSVLLRFKGRNYQALNMGRNINENTDLQAATPAIEISRIRDQFSRGEQILRILAVVIIVISGISVFISLFTSLRERRYELALMRSMGAGRSKVFGLILIEGLLLGLIGFVVGIALGHFIMEMVGNSLESSYGYNFSGWQWLREEWLLLLAALGIGFLAAFIPAMQAAETDIADTLTH
ncbi:MAG: FtsX-like permease family protein [Bacteroidota bacterium]